MMASFKTMNRAGSRGTGNRLLDRLPKSEYSRLEPHWEPIATSKGKEVYRRNGPMPHVYFPTTGIYSIVVVLNEGKKVEAATIGNEGMVGIPAVLGLDASPVSANLQLPGEALRLPTTTFLQAMKPGSLLETVVRRYTAYSLEYANQTIACNLLHSAPERMCRWLLMTHDRAGDEEFRLTHEYLAEMLGVRRQTVTGIAGRLQAAGFIVYRRGAMRVVDRQRLEAASCECYQVTKDLYDRILN